MRQVVLLYQGAVDEYSGVPNKAGVQVQLCFFINLWGYILILVDYMHGFLRCVGTWSVT